MKKKLQKLSIHFSLILFLTSKFLLVKTLIFQEGLIQFVGDDPVTFILEKYQNHPSIIAMQNFCHENISFNFETIKQDHVLKKIKSLDISKTSQNTDVPFKIIKENAVNEAIQSENFPSCLKWADVTPILKKGLRSQVDNYRPVSFFQMYRDYLKDLYLIIKIYQSYFIVYRMNF